MKAVHVHLRVREARAPRSSSVGERLRHALGFQATYELGAAVPGWLCGGSLHRGLGRVTEVGHNDALANRLGRAMTNTGALNDRNRPAGVAWETLTHGDNPG